MKHDRIRAIRVHESGDTTRPDLSTKTQSLTGQMLDQSSNYINKTGCKASMLQFILGKGAV